MSADPLTTTIARLQQMCNAARFDAVERETRTLVQAHPHDPRVLFVRAVALGHNGRRAEARPMLQQAIDLQPNVPAYYQMLAHFCLVDEDFAEAHAAYDAALSRWPTHAPTLSLKADLLVSQREHDAAAPILTPLLTQRPVDPGVARTFG
ncbi:MAG: tetratricopeptide repeat protein, partial [Phycisphaerales bacterium]|nr:tetratricopeptide repeat protein [Phycisphaerales bacterium]